MGIDVCWRDESGATLSHLPDSDFLLSKLWNLLYRHPGSCVRYIDPAGDTCFNQQQLSDLILELHQVRTNVPDGRHAQHLDQVIELATQAQGRAHTYVWFIGD